jgi:putative hemolysin
MRGHQPGAVLGTIGDARARAGPPDAAPRPSALNPGLAPSLARIGGLEVRLAATAGEVELAQQLRYRVFYEEMSAVPGSWSRLARRDHDAFDEHCDHLLVFDRDIGGNARPPAVVGTYRLLRQEVAERHCGFYTGGEFDIGALILAHPGRRFLELGRSCVLAPYRTRRTVELLWRGIYAYVRHHRMDVLIGCASLEGTDPAALAGPLSFLHHHAAAAPPWAARAVEGRRVPMDNIRDASLDAARAFRALPPLLKGYLRLGAMIGDGAVIDRQFNTTDVLVILPMENVGHRYLDFLSAAPGDMAA